MRGQSSATVRLERSREAVRLYLKAICARVSTSLDTNGVGGTERRVVRTEWEGLCVCRVTQPFLPYLSFPYPSQQSHRAHRTMPFGPDNHMVVDRNIQPFACLHYVARHRYVCA